VQHGGGAEISDVTDFVGFRIDQSTATSGAVRLQLHGELDLAVVPDLATRLEELKGRHQQTELDLSGLSFMDSTGLGTLLTAMVDARREGWNLVIGPELTRPVQRMVDIAGAGPYLWPEATA
jgi:anti-anti-sigma factor